MNPLRSERGVAMIIVLLVGASLTAVSSVATFAMIREFGASDDDRKSAQALAAAEAGVDRFLAYLKSGKVTYGLLNQAGCNGNPPLALAQGQIGASTYSASITVYDPDPAGAAQFPPAACLSRPTRPVLGQDGVGNSWFVITSIGSFAEATKVIRQTVALQPIGLPVGIYGRSITVSSANHRFLTVSMVSETTIQNRSDLEFEGLDPWYVMRNVFPDPAGDLALANVTGAQPFDPVPAAAHAAGQIFLGNARDPEYPPTSNCTANGKGGDSAAQRAQSIWDSDGSGGSGPITTGCSAWPGYSPVGGGAGVYPRSSKFTGDQLSTFASPRLTEEDYQTLKDAAKTYGVYCSLPGNGGSGEATCTRAGTVVTGAAADYFTQVKTLADAGEKNILGYVEFRAGAVTANNVPNSVDLGHETVWGCNADPDLSKSLVTIVRRGGVAYGGSGGDWINGAFILDGNWAATGGFRFNGSLVVQGNLHFHSASQNYGLDACWVANTPGPFFRVVPNAWSEIDR